MKAAVEVGGDSDGEVEAGGDEGEVFGRAAQTLRVPDLEGAAQMQKIAGGAFLQLEHVLDPAASLGFKLARELAGVKIAARLGEGGAYINIDGNTFEPVAENGLELAGAAVDLKRRVPDDDRHGTGLVEDEAHAAGKLHRDVPRCLIIIYNSIGEKNMKGKIISYSISIVFLILFVFVLTYSYLNTNFSQKGNIDYKRKYYDIVFNNVNSNRLVRGINIEDGKII